MNKNAKESDNHLLPYRLVLLIIQIIIKANNKYGLSWEKILDKRRAIISEKIDKDFGSTVKYGPFSGLKLSSRSWWGSHDRASMLLGLYEREILESINKIPAGYGTFIDLGAADGYYGIGVLINNLFKNSICYEISELGQKIISDNARLNNVIDRVEIRGAAKKNFYEDISPLALERSVILIDIEGAEFDLMDEFSFQALRKSIIFIEMHEWFFKNGAVLRKKLIDDSSKSHFVSEIKMGSRDLSSYEELSSMNDNDRWIICSEGRGQLMSWLRFDPLDTTS